MDSQLIVITNYHSTSVNNYKKLSICDNIDMIILEIDKYILHINKQPKYFYICNNNIEFLLLNEEIYREYLKYNCVICENITYPNNENLNIDKFPEDGIIWDGNDYKNMKNHLISLIDTNIIPGCDHIENIDELVIESVTYEDEDEYFFKINITYENILEDMIEKCESIKL